MVKSPEGGWPQTGRVVPKVYALCTVQPIIQPMFSSPASALAEALARAGALQRRRPNAGLACHLLAKAVPTNAPLPSGGCAVR
ncbi:hypothetical protein DTW89_11250 [Acidovorax sp. BoFeN1]|nr:hypothetical protein DTW89_11250 [Acidovorax sp. BoFeN1]